MVDRVEEQPDILRDERPLGLLDRLRLGEDVLDQRFGLRDVEPALHNGLQGLHAADRVVHAQQRAGVALGEPVFQYDPLLLARKAQQADLVRKGGLAHAEPPRRLLLCHRTVPHQGVNGRGFFKKFKSLRCMFSIKASTAPSDAL